MREESGKYQDALSVRCSYLLPMREGTRGVEAGTLQGRRAVAEERPFGPEVIIRKGAFGRGMVTNKVKLLESDYETGVSTLGIDERVTQGWFPRGMVPEDRSG
jgi:hypothetical protein